MESELPYDLLLQLLRQTLGTRVELVDYQIGNQLHDYLVLLLRLEHPAVEIVVKLAGSEAPYACPFERTAMLHRLVAARTTIPMPEVLAVDESYETWPWRYLIKTHIPGLEWADVQPQMDEEELADAYGQIGDAVAQLHNIHFPAFGVLRVGGDVQGQASCLAALTEHARHVIKSARLGALFCSVLDKAQALFSDVGSASLCHEDLHKHNILFHHRLGRWHLATILDFDKGWAGHHETDLARLELWKGMTSPEFWSSYKAVSPVEPLYEQRRPIYQLLWCLEYARATQEHLADTRRICTVLGLPPLERFE